MKVINSILALLLTSLLFVCCDESLDSSSERYSGSDIAIGGDGGVNDNGQAGLITAGEWNDLDNWNFWMGLLENQDYSKRQNYWNFFTQRRIPVSLKHNDNPVCNAKVELRKNSKSTWVAKTDNLGRAELWIELFQEQKSINVNDYELFINDKPVASAIKLFTSGLNEIEVNANTLSSNRVEISFIVDATGSMGDELEFLKNDLKDLIQRVNNSNTVLNIYTSAVFYRDQGDDYLVKHSDFTEITSTTLDFIKKQSANGGGDFPEAVHSGLKKALELQWSDDAKTKIAFLLLDAPPHYDRAIIDDLHASVKKAAEKGIKLIPITASGIDKETEFLMRFISIATNGTYVFVTNDSGIGNEHIQASVGEYKVEFLNDLMVRLINKYTE